VRRSGVIGIVGGPVEALVFPHPLPFRFDLRSVVPRHDPCMVTNARVQLALGTTGDGAGIREEPAVISSVIFDAGTGRENRYP
jgi:hypothetical protein